METDEQIMRMIRQLETLMRRVERADAERIEAEIMEIWEKCRL